MQRANNGSAVADWIKGIETARARVERLEQQLAQARRDYHAAIADAHNSGVSMAELGRALGVTRQRIAELLGRSR